MWCCEPVPNQSEPICLLYIDAEQIIAFKCEISGLIIRNNCQIAIRPLDGDFFYRDIFRTTEFEGIIICWIAHLIMQLDLGAVAAFTFKCNGVDSTCARDFEKTHLLFIDAFPDFKNYRTGNSGTIQSKCSIRESWKIGISPTNGVSTAKGSKQIQIQGVIEFVEVVHPIGVIHPNLELGP